MESSRFHGFMLVFRMELGTLTFICHFEISASTVTECGTAGSNAYEDGTNVVQITISPLLDDISINGPFSITVVLRHHQARLHRTTTYRGGGVGGGCFCTLEEIIIWYIVFPSLCTRVCDTLHFILYLILAYTIFCTIPKELDFQNGIKTK